MARLPTPGGDDGTWGSVLNEFLGVGHNSDGTLKGSARKVDLGVINAVDLIGAPLDLNLTIQAVAGDWVFITVAHDNFVQHDSNSIIVVHTGDVGNPLLYWQSNDTTPERANSGVYGGGGAISDGGSILMQLTGSDPTVGSIHLEAIVIGAAAVTPGSVASDIAVLSPLTGNVQTLLEKMPRNVDLGIINATDLISAPLDLNLTIQAAEGDVVQLVVARDNFAPHDSDDQIAIPMYDTGYSTIGLLSWRAGDSVPEAVLFENNYGSPPSPFISDGGPILMSLTGSDPTVGSIHLRAIVIPA